MKQTSIEWLVDQIKEDQTSRAKTASEWNLIFQQARQMHKEEVKEGYIMALLDKDNKIRRDAEDYYQETYGK